MAFLWPLSRIPWTDPNGDPYSGALLYFYEGETSTPRAVYTTAELAIPHDRPITANGSGQFPAVFMTPSTPYRVRATSADGSVVLFDDDMVSIPVLSVAESGGDGEPPEVLAQTGDFKWRYDSGAHDGWVRSNGRTIGSASSGAAERANADCEDLFNHLWNIDADLTVSGGRGGSSASDWAANKTIGLPDLRGRTIVGRDSMGNSAAGRIDSSNLSGGQSADALGDVAGSSVQTLTTQQIPAHLHTGTTNSDGSHSHAYVLRNVLASNIRNGSDAQGQEAAGLSTQSTTSGGAHTHAFSTNFAGGGEAHPNVQPSMFMTGYLKL